MSDQGEDVLNLVSATLRTFCVFPDKHSRVAVTLWAALTHIIEEFYVAPRLALVSPEPECGKSLLLGLLALLTPNPMFTLSASPPAIFRTLADTRVTLLFDEVDAIWSSRGKNDNHEDLRALLNAGYKRGATIPRCVGPKHEVQHFDVFCPVALASIGQMPETIMSRSVIIRMRRMTPNEEKQLSSYRPRCDDPMLCKLRDSLAAWAETIGKEAGNAWPKLPRGIINRPAEIWEPLIAIADAAGGDWPKMARAACVHLVEAAKDRRVSLGIRLLGDLRTIFADRDAMTTADIIERLTAEDSVLDDDAPWASLRGNPIDSRKLASLLKQYDIHSTKVRVGSKPLQGYRREDLWDTWQRYLPSMSVKAEQAEQTEQEAQETAPVVPGVPDMRGTKNGQSTVRELRAGGRE